MKQTQILQEGEYQFPYHYIVEYEPIFAQSKSWTWGINYAATLELIISKLKPKNFKSIVDIGTGDGRLVRELSRKYPNKKITGIEYSKRAAGLARALYPEGNFLCKDITKEKIGINADVVTLIEVIEHIPPDKLKKFIESVGELLKKRGKLFVTAPHNNMPVQRKHFQHFNSKKLKELFDRDYEIKDIRFLGKQGWEYQLILKLLENKLFILNEQNLLNKIYEYYKKNIFFCHERECSRIYLELMKK